jgi:hypothetical protein
MAGIQAMQKKAHKKKQALAPMAGIQNMQKADQISCIHMVLYLKSKDLTTSNGITAAEANTQFGSTTMISAEACNPGDIVRMC